jgi:hypothetical protein
MPYKGEIANKSSHYDIVRNPDVAQFLEGCEYLKPPSPEESANIAAHFVTLPPTELSPLPERVVAIDGSYYEAHIDDRLPSTKVGYVKIGAIMIDMERFRSLRVLGDRYVDPFQVAALQNDNSALTFALPSANVRSKGKADVRESFRAAIDAQLYDKKTRFNEQDPTTSLRTTLFHLAAFRPLDELGTTDPTRLMIHKCPTCGSGPVEVHDIPDPQYCQYCHAQVYPADCLRVWEEVSDFQSNVQAMSRFMLQVEHMLPVHYIRYLVENSLASLGALAFFVDGPLAVFGNGAWLSRSIMRFLAETSAQLQAVHQPGILMIGLQKTGQVVDHFALIERYIEPNRIFPIDDDYRYKYILAGRDPAGNGFGDETYYGQDFLYKTSSGRNFVFGLPYPCSSKRIPDKSTFLKCKTDLNWYSELPRALALVNQLESDLYENAVVPIALAHRYTAISLKPGGKVLDILTRRALERQRK